MMTVTQTRPINRAPSSGKWDGLIEIVAPGAIKLIGMILNNIFASNHQVRYVPHKQAKRLPRQTSKKPDPDQIIYLEPIDREP